MRVQFTATFDELVDATLRVVRRVREGNRAGRLVGLVVCALGTATLLASCGRQAFDTEGR